MDESIAHRSGFDVGARSEADAPAWKTWLSWACAIISAILFLSAGIWKLTDPIGWSVKVTQLLVPQNLSTAAALSLGIGETFAGILVLIPRYRRWGAWLISAMLVIFMIYVGANYSALQGEECSCFPWVKRAVGPGFFVGDAIMLGFAIGAGLLARASHGLKNAAILLTLIAVFAGGSYAYAASKQTGTLAPPTVTLADGSKMSLLSGKVFIYFFDPECLHCLHAAQAMAPMNWGDTKIIAVPTNVPQFAQDFLDRTKLNAVVSNDLELLKEKFPFPSTPAGVAIENGYQTGLLTQFEDQEPEASLKKLGLVK